MKQNNRIRLCLTVVTLILTALLLTACSPKNAKGIIKDSVITVASFNSPADEIAGGDTDALKDTLNSLSDKGIAYVSFLGRFTHDPEDIYSEYVKNKFDTKKIKAANLEDVTWMMHKDNLANVLEVAEKTGIPYGVTYSFLDTFGKGGYRDSTYADIYTSDTAIGEKASGYGIYSVENYYTTVEKDGQKFIIFQLEGMPTTPVLDWFNTTMKEKSDYRAIVFTESLIDGNGEFWTMWDWADGYPYKAENRGNTKLNGYNILWTDKPCDGTALWNYALSKHDNLILVVTSNADVNGEIATRVEKTAGGCDVALIATRTASDALLVGISEDNKTIHAAVVNDKGEFANDSYTKLKLETVSALEPPIDKNISRVIQMQPNGANIAYMTVKGNEFKPEKAITRGEVIDAIATLIGKHPQQKRADNRFKDIDDEDKYYDSVNYLDSQDHLDYIYDEKIAVKTAMTRGELARLLYRTASLVDSFAGVISDVSEDDESYYEYGAVISSGYMTLDESNAFNPENKVTRADFVSIMNRVIGLSASEKTIDAALLDTTFTDIEDIAEKYDILAATNDNVKAPYHKDINTIGITETATAFVFDNGLATMTVEKAEATVTEIKINKTGENILFTTGSLIELDSPATRSCYPVSMKRDGDRFRFTFDGGEVVYMIIESHDGFFTFELDTELPVKDSCLTFAAFDTAKNFSDKPESIRLSGTLMNTNTYTEYYGGGDAKATGASVTKSFLDTMGAKYGVVASEYQDFVKAMQKLADDIDPAVGLVNKAGGAYSTAHESNYGDYCIISSLKPGEVPGMIALALKYNLKQIDIHQGAKTFIQGDYIPGEGFRFTNVKDGTPAAFKEAVSDKFHKAGLELGLHIYSFYVSPDADNVLSVPEYQKQFEYSETFTLAEDFSKLAKRIKTVEDCSDFDMATSFTYKNSKYILVDEEIMQVVKVSGDDTLVVSRGLCGTQKAEHKAGAEIRHLIQYYGMFAPIIGSELFCNMAEWVAETYNKGGFDMIYFDAHDGIGKHTTEQWYYGAEFIRIVLEHCEKPPVVEHSAQYPSLWAGRSRLIAWDTATRAYKQFNLNHLETNKDWMNRMYPTTFGWFNYAPDTSYPEKNTLAKTLFKDDIDHMGSLAIAWNVSTVYNSFESVRGNRIMAENIGYYNVYNKLRLEGYFSEDVKEQIRKGKYEYKLEELSDGSWAFREMRYSKAKIYDADDESFNTGSGYNPFGEQTPFIRIESRYSTESEQETTLLELDETKSVSSHVGKHTNLKLPKLTNTKALKVKVLGNGSKNDAIMITLTYNGPGIYEYTDYVIPLDFEGWKEIVLVDSDCGDYGYTFSNRNVNAVSWDIFREIPDYSKINGIEIAISGSCAEVKIDDIVACKHTEAPVKNPSVTIGEQTITFKTTVKGGQYIEYYPETGKAELNYNNGKTEEIPVTGSITVPEGNFEFTYSAEALTDAPVRAQVVIGCKGKLIANN